MLHILVDLEADISQLEAPTFTTINRGPPEPMLRLDWSHKVNLIGEKVLNPMIHCCDKCLKPILIYGRMVRLLFFFILTVSCALFGIAVGSVFKICAVLLLSVFMFLMLLCVIDLIFKILHELKKL